MVSETKGQPTWHALGLSDLRTLPPAQRLPPIPEQKACTSAEEAAKFLIAYLDGVNHVETPCGLVELRAEHIPHIVEKRQEARERFIELAIATLKSPYEVWRVQYDDHSTRLAFIGLSVRRDRQMLVIVTARQGQVLWNYMHSDAKHLNKHRHGTLIYATAT